MFKEIADIMNIVIQESNRILIGSLQTKPLYFDYQSLINIMSQNFPQYSLGMLAYYIKIKLYFQSSQYLKEIHLDQFEVPIQENMY